ncbi:hypothetical protein LG634_17170 [Streptomyces bambusae]|uniref:hypothetical protein n=1 Tax=Streptomyces bambusae TaxID=1550616 RepID=UPI001CFE4CF3|nr:hypothetical protein [Streptomyces bambusae]MCB5166561.1 hypothetical protein [Streptomyces bambusae]
MPGSRVPGRTWTVRLVGHADHSASVTCSNDACRMPARSKDTAALKRFAAEHVRAHAKLAVVRPHAACTCRAAQCALHESTRTQCVGSSMLVLVHNPAVGQVWTLAEMCQACARVIPHASVVSRAQEAPSAAAPASRSAAASVPAPAKAPGQAPGQASAPAPALAPVPSLFSSPQAAPEAPVDRRRPRRQTRPRRSA